MKWDSSQAPQEVLDLGAQCTEDMLDTKNGDTPRPIIMLFYLQKAYELGRSQPVSKLGESDGESEAKADKPVIKSDRLKDHQQSPFEDTD